MRARRNADGLGYVRLSAMGPGLCRRVTSLRLMRSVDVIMCLVHPALRVRITGEVEQPAQQADAIASPEPEASREPGK